MLRQLLRQVLQPFSRRLEVRIVALFMGLLLLVQLTSSVTIRQTIDLNAHAQIAAELRTGENILRRLLAQNAQQLSEGAFLLAADYGFRSAIASSDRETLVDALENQSARIGASIALFTDPHRRLVASTLIDGDQGLSLVQTPRAARSTPVTARDSTVRVLDEQPFQLVTVPVNAPKLIGHVSMGFPLNGKLLRDMEEVSSLKMGLMLRLRGGAWRVLPIGEHATALQPIAAQLTHGTPLRKVALYGDDNGARLVALGGNQTDEEVVAVLLRSVDEALAPYRRLELFLLGIALAGLAVFGVGSVVTARRITGPIKALSQSAVQLGAGEYSTPVQVTSRDEIHDLAQSFEAMRNGIQQREVQIARLAYWDTLTGLPNREQFRDLLRDRIERARAAGETCAVVIFDLDRFKHVNDILGHAFGDRLLCQIAARLQHGVMREQDVLARFGGDEFVVCLPQADADTGSDTARRIRHALEQPLTLDDHTVDVGAGAGVASFPKDGDDADTLLG
ncbi:MAG: diguanylate cyclase, partial [Burkholderiaceae bacterium]|nr:diguanylate cyclase [Burkholderiaceae bacterium]